MVSFPVVSSLSTTLQAGVRGFERAQGAIDAAARHVAEGHIERGAIELIEARTHASASLATTRVADESLSRLIDMVSAP